MIVLGIIALILLGFIYNRLHNHLNYPTTTTTSTKSVIVKQPVYVNTNTNPNNQNVNYNQPPPHYNSYKAQYYN